MQQHITLTANLFEEKIIVGVDEAGRGPLAGSVIAAAVVLNPAHPVAGLNDSKKLTASSRESLYQEICTYALDWAIGRADVAEIDTLNILQASLLAMRRAVLALQITPNLVLVDGNRCPVIPYSTHAIIGGDSTVASISAASILAKVTRDHEMNYYAEIYPEYGFAKHKGYGTPQHLQALKQYGPSAIHRRSFAPVRACLDKEAI